MCLPSRPFFVLLPLLVLYGFSVSAAAAQASSGDAGATPAYASNPKFVKSLGEARQLEHHQQPAFAADAYKKANKLAGGQCEECFSGLYTAELEAGNYKDAVAAAVALEAMETDPLVKSNAASLRAHAMVLQAGTKPKPAQLEAADAVYQEAIASNPNNAAALYQDGKVLARLGKMEQARKEFQQCVSCMRPNDPAALRAKHFAANPSLSLEKMAPPIAVTALDGTKFNLDAMGGRVVLIDFWATWCGPCNEELPHMKKIAKEFAGQPLVIISVSWDSDAQTWKNFIQKNEMTWVQYRDKDHSLSRAFGVEAIPHYFTIDADGVLTSEMLGEGSDVEGKLRKLVAKAKQEQAEGKTEAASVAKPDLVPVH